MAYSFDCDTRVIQLDSTAQLDMADLYSRWKDEVIADLMIGGCLQGLRVIKEPLAGATSLGPYYFTMNDWQIRPLDVDHQLEVIGTVVQDASSAEPPFKLDDLTARVEVIRQVAVDVQTIETGVSGLTAPESAKLMSIPTAEENALELLDNQAAP